MCMLPESQKKLIVNAMPGVAAMQYSVAMGPQLGGRTGHRCMSTVVDVAFLC